jgi:hypothetical protein
MNRYAPEQLAAFLHAADCFQDEDGAWHGPDEAAGSPANGTNGVTGNGAPGPRAGAGEDRAARIERARKYVARMPVGISGSHGHDAARDVAVALVRGFALTAGEAWPLLLEFSGRCQPPWSDKELRHKLDDAEHTARLPFGFIINRKPPSGGPRPGPSPATNGTGGGHDPQGAPPTPGQAAPAAAAAVQDAHAIILAHLRECLLPTFKKDANVYSARLGRPVAMKDAVTGIGLIRKLAAAANAPRDGRGAPEGGPEEIAQVLVHEMAHYANFLDGIGDCPPNQYHNRPFKSHAESVGLVVEKTSSRGWAHISLGPGLLARVQEVNLDADAFSLFRKGAGRKKQPTKMKKWRCGCTNIRAATEVDACCNACGEAFVRVG